MATALARNMAYALCGPEVRTDARPLGTVCGPLPVSVKTSTSTSQKGIGCSEVSTFDLSGRRELHMHILMSARGSSEQYACPSLVFGAEALPLGYHEPRRCSMLAHAALVHIPEAWQHILWSL